MSIRKMATLLLIPTLAIFSLPIWADDETPPVANAHTAFATTLGVILLDETVTITKLKSLFAYPKFSIDVDVHVENTSDTPITKKITFALPPVKCQVNANTMWQGLDGTGSDDALDDGLKDFTVSINGQPFVVAKRLEAVAGEKNITDLLNKLQVPLNPCQIKTMSDGALDPKYNVILQKYHLLGSDNKPIWSENIYFEWMQTFLPHQVFNLHQHYTPIAGISVPAPRSINDLNDWFNANDPSYYPHWNSNPMSLATTNPTLIYKNKDLNYDHQQRFCLAPTWVRFNLISGAYWNGSIGVFKLIINDDNGAPFAVNEFYKKSDPVGVLINANQFIYQIKNFMPSHDLLVLYLGLPQGPADLQLCGIK